MCEHVCNGRAVCRDKGNTEVGCCTEYDISPSLANMRKVIPPACLDPFPPPPIKTGKVTLVFA